MRVSLLTYGLLLALYGCAVPEGARRPFGAEDEQMRLLVRGSRLASQAESIGPAPPPVPADGPLTVVHLFRMADLYHPELAAARAEVGAAEGRRLQERLYPNPTLEVASEEAPVGGGGLREAKTVVSVSQPVILGGRRRAAVEAADAELEGRRLALAERRREVHADIRRACTNLLYYRAAEDLLTALHASAESTRSAAAARFEGRAAPELEVLKSRVESERLALTLGRARRDREAVAARLAALVGGRLVAVERLAGTLAADLPALDADAADDAEAVRARHPAVLLARQEEAAARHRLRQARAERLGDLDLRFGLGRDGADDATIVEAGLALPLPIFDRNQGRILEAEHLLTKAEREKQAAVNRLIADLATARADYETAREQATAYDRSIVPAAERALAQTREAWQAGRQGFLDLLDAQRTLAETRQTRLEALRDLNLAWVRLVEIRGPEADEHETHTPPRMGARSAETDSGD